MQKYLFDEVQSTTSSTTRIPPKENYSKPKSYFQKSQIVKQTKIVEMSTTTTKKTNKESSDADEKSCNSKAKTSHLTDLIAVGTIPPKSPKTSKNVVFKSSTENVDKACTENLIEICTTKKVEFQTDPDCKIAIIQKSKSFDNLDLGVKVKQLK
jgi:hypothetical protein